MKLANNRLLIFAAIAGAMSTVTAPAQTPERVETRIGTLNFEQGYPTAETAQKLYDEMDFQRAVQAFLWSFPAVSFESIRVGIKQGIGADYNDLIIADNFADPKGIWLTANDTTIYGMVNVDLSQGPVVLEVPAGPGVGLIDDFWQRAITDFGLPGPDKGKGGKYLLLPPGYNGEVPKEGYFVLQGTMNNYNIMDRGLVENNDLAAAVNLIKNLRVYPWGQRDNPKANKVFSMSAKTYDTTPPNGIEYWARLSAFINNNPVHERDRFTWPCSSRSVSRKARSSSRMRGNARSSRKPQRLVTRWRERSSSMRSSASAMRSPFRAPTGLGSCSWITTRKLIPTASSTSGCTTSTARSTCRPPSGESGGTRRHLHPVLRGQGWQPLRWRQVLPLAPAPENTGIELLVADSIRHSNPLHDPERGQ